MKWRFRDRDLLAQEATALAPSSSAGVRVNSANLWLGKSVSNPFRESNALAVRQHHHRAALLNPTWSCVSLLVFHVWTPSRRCELPRGPAWVSSDLCPGTMCSKVGMQRITRRDLGKTAAMTGALAVRTHARAGTVQERSLGKTGLQVGVLGIGTGPFGREEITQADVNDVIAAAADCGVNYLDTAPIYAQSERRLGKALQGKREKFVLVTKVEATSKQDAMWQVRDSLQKTRAEYFDLVHLHNVGRTDRFPSLDVLLGNDGALAGLEQMKKQGLVRHIGMTSHLRPRRALPILRSGRIEVVMAAVNCIDRSHL